MDPSHWMLSIASYLWFVMLKVRYVCQLSFKPTIDAPTSWTSATDTSLPATFADPANGSATLYGADAVHTITYFQPTQRADYGLILYEHPPGEHDGLLLFLQSYWHHAMLILLAPAILKCALTLWRWACSTSWDLPKVHWRGTSTSHVGDTPTTPSGSQDLPRPTEDKQTLQDLTQRMSSWREKAEAFEKALKSVKANLNASVKRESKLQAMVEQQAAEHSAFAKARVKETEEMRRSEDTKFLCESAADRKKLKQAERGPYPNLGKHRQAQILETAVSTLRNQNARLAEDVARLEGKIQGLEVDSEQLTTMKEGKTALTSDTAGCLHGLEPDVQQTAANKQLEDEIDALKRRRDDLKAEKQNLDAENGDLERRTSKLANECKGLQSRAETLSTGEEELNGKISKLTDKCKGLQSQTETLTDFEKELNGKVLKLDEECKVLESRTKELSEEKDALASSILKLKDERDGLEKQNNKLSDTAKALTDNISQLEGQRDDAQSETAALRESEAALKANVQKLADQRENLEVQKDTLSTDKSRLETRISELATERNSLEEVIAGSRSISAAPSTPQIASSGPTSTPDFTVQGFRQSAMSFPPAHPPFNHHEQPMGPSGDAAVPDSRSMSGEANFQQLASDRPATQVDSTAQRYDQGPDSGPTEDMDVNTPDQQLSFQPSFFQHSSLQQRSHLFGQDASSASAPPFAFDFITRDGTTPKINMSGLGGKIFKFAAGNADGGHRGDGRSGRNNQLKIAPAPEKLVAPPVEWEMLDFQRQADKPSSSTIPDATVGQSESAQPPAASTNIFEPRNDGAAAPAQDAGAQGLAPATSSGASTTQTNAVSQPEPDYFTPDNFVSGHRACIQCPAVFNNREMLLTHMHDKHGEPSSSQCNCMTCLATNNSSREDSGDSAPSPPAGPSNVSGGAPTSNPGNEVLYCSQSGCGKILDMVKGQLCYECYLERELQMMLDGSDSGSEDAGSESEDRDSGFEGEVRDAPPNGGQQLDEDAGDCEPHPHHSGEESADPGDEEDPSEEDDSGNKGESGEEEEDDYDPFADDLCAERCGEKLESKADISRGYCPGCWDKHLRARFEDERPKMPLKTRKR